LKNKEYQFEHNYGHGNKSLSNNFLQIMMLAFLIDQILEMADKRFIKMLEVLGKKKYLWEKLKSFYDIFVIENWDQFYQMIIDSGSGKKIFINTE